MRLLALAWLLVGTVVQAGILQVPLGSESRVEASRWQVIDLIFDAEEHSEAPFEEAFHGLFRNPDGRVLRVPGFFDGGRRWVLRFSAPEEGTWRYETSSSLASLAGHDGEIAVGPADGKHGALVCGSDQPQHFFYEDGTACTVLAFEADWLFALDYDNPEATPKTDRLLAELQKNGINQIVTTVYSHDVKWEKDPRLEEYPEYEYGGREDIYPFLGTNQKPDFSGLNPEFFQRFDRVVEAMDEAQITAHLMIYVWNKMVRWPDAETREDNRYFDYIIKRYQAFPNVLWDVSKEALNNARCSEDYGIERIERIRRLDAYGRLVTVHDGGFCQRNPEVVDFISWQNWSANIYSDMLEVHERFPEHPVFNIEHGGYEESPFVVFPGDYVDPEVCLRRNYLIMFAGAYSTYYWQGASWNVLIHDPFERADFLKPRFDYYKHLSSFFKRHPFAGFEPWKEQNYSAYCLRNKEDDVYLVYLPKEHHQISIYGKKGIMREGGSIRWFNVLTGEYRDGERTTAHSLASPWRGEADSILIRDFGGN